MNGIYSSEEREEGTKEGREEGKKEGREGSHTDTTGFLGLL